MDKELSQELTKAAEERLPALGLTAEDMCRVTTVTLDTLARFLRKHTNFNSARHFEFVGKSVNDFLEREDAQK